METLYEVVPLPKKRVWHGTILGESRVAPFDSGLPHREWFAEFRRALGVGEMPVYDEARLAVHQPSGALRVTLQGHERDGRWYWLPRARCWLFLDAPEQDLLPLQWDLALEGLQEGGFRLTAPPLAGLGVGFEILAGGDSRAVVLGRCPCPPHDGLREQLQEFLLVERLRTL